MRSWRIMFLFLFLLSSPVFMYMHAEEETTDFTLLKIEFARCLSYLRKTSHKEKYLIEAAKVICEYLNQPKSVDSVGQFFEDSFSKIPMKGFLQSMLFDLEPDQPEYKAAFILQEYFEEPEDYNKFLKYRRSLDPTTFKSIASNHFGHDLRGDGQIDYVKIFES